MLLTTGVALGHGAHVQRLLVERTVEVARAAAIGFSVAAGPSEVPAIRCASRARRRNCR